MNVKVLIIEKKPNFYIFKKQNQSSAWNQSKTSRVQILESYVSIYNLSRDSNTAWQQTWQIRMRKKAKKNNQNIT